MNINLINKIKERLENLPDLFLHSEKSDEYLRHKVFIGIPSQNDIDEELNPLKNSAMYLFPSSSSYGFDNNGEPIATNMFSIYINIFNKDFDLGFLDLMFVNEVIIRNLKEIPKFYDDNNFFLGQISEVNCQIEPKQSRPYFNSVITLSLDVIEIEEKNEII